MDAQQKVGAVQLSARLRGMSPPVTRRLLISEQASLAQLHAVLQVAFGWSDEHLYTFQIRGWQFGDPFRAIELVNKIINLKRALRLAPQSRHARIHL
jgi:hypothetical protein